MKVPLLHRANEHSTAHAKILFVTLFCSLAFLVIVSSLNSLRKDAVPSTETSLVNLISKNPSKFLSSPGETLEVFVFGNFYGINFFEFFKNPPTLSRSDDFTFCFIFDVEEKKEKLPFLLI